MKGEPTESTKDAEGILVFPGDIVYIRSSSGWISRQIKTCYEYKVEYTDPCPAGYEGARYNLIYFNRPPGLHTD